jgi:Acyclic terpene utilisation family protein AtuA
MPRGENGVVRIGSGAGFAGDRLEPAVILAERGALQYLGLECLAERTIALAQLRKLKEPAEGYDVLLARRMELLLPVLKKKRVRLVTNMGAANPVAAADLIVAIARRRKLDIKVAAVTGDDVLKLLKPGDRVLETGEPLSAYKWLVSANAYLGVDALLPALATGADVIVTGRVADPSLFLAPAVYEYGWDLDDLDRMARGTVMGHLLECAGQITGGYFADPGRKDVPDFAHLGFPYADIDRDGNCVVGKAEGTGGVINLMTAKEQLLYEVTDPHAYVTPDIVADFTTVRVKGAGANRVAFSGATGKPRSATLKVSIGYHAGYVGEGEISYAGTNALQRARLAGEVVHERLKSTFAEIRVDYIGSTSLHGKSYCVHEHPYELRLRVAARAATREKAALVGEEVEALWTNGPAGGGGARKYVHEQVGIVSSLIAREKVKTEVTVREWRREKETV